ncbi:reverse transcriptase domain-containing protein [Tanacetum coccineum]|uniref:Reverse transcriptase domain-containing protein n=1 Tax=Tanacetum coccineum TaxID=301880 RepID=A0ABQ5C6C0_9ASTR
MFVHHRLQIQDRESSTARPTKGRGIDYGFVSMVDAEERRQGIRDVGYDIRGTWVDPAEAVPEIVPMTVGEVNTRVTELAELHKHDTQDLYALLEDAQDSRSRISQRVDMHSQRVDLLMGDRMNLQEIVWMVEEEAYTSREAWAHSIGLSQATHQELQTHYDHQTELAALRETGRKRQAQRVETHRIIRDMRREMSDMQAELLALREQIMAPTTRRGQNTPVNNTNPNNMTPESIQAMIDQALLRNSTNGDGSHNKTLGPEWGQNANDFGKYQEKDTDKYCPQKPRIYIERHLTTKGMLDDHPETTMVNLQQPFKGRMSPGLKYRDRRKEALWVIFAQVHHVPSFTTMPVPPEYHKCHKVGHFARELQEYEKRVNASGNPDAQCRHGPSSSPGEPRVLIDKKKDGSFIKCIDTIQYYSKHRSEIRISPLECDNKTLPKTAFQTRMAIRVQGYAFELTKHHRYFMFLMNRVMQALLGNNVQKDTGNGNVQRIIGTSSSRNALNVQCYNCNAKGHYARECPKPRVRDSKYFMEQMLLAKKDKVSFNVCANVRDTEKTIEDATKSKLKMQEKLKDMIAIEKKSELSSN